MTDTKAFESILDKENVKYRSFNLAEGKLFFCSAEDGLTFDAFWGTNGVLRIWRYVLTNLPLGVRGKCFRSSVPNRENAFVRLEITDDGCLNLTAEQQLTDVSQVGEHMEKHLSGFISSIRQIDFRSIIKPLALAKESNA
ncbi:MAG: hypothetical protein E7559_00190 [Ruminococcaceae bacterium]|nr:hypothetical protein [Oscillospiraceae bacterium]